MAGRPQSTVAVVAALLAACGSDELAGPAGRDLRGTWAYSASGISPGFPPICAISGTTVTISSHSGTGFGGTYNSGFIACIGGGFNDTFPVGTGPLNGGVATGDSVRFNFRDADFRHIGSIRADTISGFLNLSILLSGTVPNVATGTWRLVRQ